MILHLCNSKNFIVKLLQLTITFTKVNEYKTNTQKNCIWNVACYKIPCDSVIFEYRGRIQSFYWATEARHRKPIICSHLFWGSDELVLGGRRWRLESDNKRQKCVCGGGRKWQCTRKNKRHQNIRTLKLVLVFLLCKRVTVG